MFAGRRLVHWPLIVISLVVGWAVLPSGCCVRRPGMVLVSDCYLACTLLGDVLCRSSQPFITPFAVFFTVSGDVIASLQRSSLLGSTKTSKRLC